MTRKPQSHVRFLTLSLPECLMEFCNVTLTFESADEILWCDHSNESSLPVLSHGAVCFSKFHKIKFGDLVKICFWLNLAVKGLIYWIWAIVLTTVFIIFHVRDVALIQGDACEPFFSFLSFFFFLAPYAALIRVSRVNLVQFSLWLLLMQLTVLSICGPIFHEVLKEFLFLSQ